MSWSCTNRHAGSYQWNYLREVNNNKDHRQSEMNTSNPYHSIFAPSNIVGILAELCMDSLIDNERSARVTSRFRQDSDKQTKVVDDFPKTLELKQPVFLKHFHKTTNFA